MYEAFSACATGASHIRRNKVCQDHAFHVNRPNFTLALVADGHGGDDYFRSDRGSRYASDSAARCITEFIETVEKLYPEIGELDEREVGRLLRGLEKSIVKKWHEKVEADFVGEPFTPEDVAGLSEKSRRQYLEGRDIERAYGTTLLAVAITDAYWFGIHIGDGKCVALYPDGSCDQPIPWDPACFLNVTTSLCDDGAADEFRHYFCPSGKKPWPVAVFAATDGIDDSYPVNNNEQYLEKLYKTIALNFVGGGFAAGLKDLQEFLPILTERGSGDDVSIAGFIDMEAAERVRERGLFEERPAQETGADEAEEKRKREKEPVGEKAASFDGGGEAAKAVANPFGDDPDEELPLDELLQKNPELAEVRLSPETKAAVPGADAVIQPGTTAEEAAGREAGGTAEKIAEGLEEAGREAARLEARKLMEALKQKRRNS